MYDNSVIKSALESMMFVWGETLSIREASDVLECDRNTIKSIFEELKQEYENKERGIRLREVDDAYQFVTPAENEKFIEKLCTPVKIRRLSQAALEVLAIIAYRQPVTRSEIDSIRGIKSERVIDGLLQKNLIEAVGHA